MAITAQAVGTWAAVNATTQTVTLPAHAAGDMLLVRAACKPFSAILSCSTSGWASIQQNVGNGTTANGNGSGSLVGGLYWKIATSSSETNPVINWTSTAAPGCAVAVVYRKDASETWATPLGNLGGDATARTSQTATFNTGAKGIGDLIDFGMFACDDVTMTVPAISIVGGTVGAVTEYPATALASGTSNDIAADGAYVMVTAASTTNSNTITETLSVAKEALSFGIRLRVTSSGATGTLGASTAGNYS